MISIFFCKECRYECDANIVTNICPNCNIGLWVRMIKEEPLTDDVYPEIKRGKLAKISFK
jgi:hypothetical protein